MPGRVLREPITEDEVDREVAGLGDGHVRGELPAAVVAEGEGAIEGVEDDGGGVIGASCANG